MKRAMVVLATLTALSACANVSDGEPSYLGVAPGNIESASAAPRNAPRAVRHVTSNRVLGAMAFEKVTGAKVDPTSLEGRAP